MKKSGKKTEQESKKKGSRKVTLEIEEPVYERLRSELGLKVAMGNFHGLQDELTKIIVSTMEKGDDFVLVSMKDTKKELSKDSKK